MQFIIVAINLLFVSWNVIWILSTINWHRKVHSQVCTINDIDIIDKQPPYAHLKQRTNIRILHQPMYLLSQNLMIWYFSIIRNYKRTSLNPQNLRNIIKRVAKISIIQILMSNLSVKTTVFCYFLQLFRYPTNFARLR